MSLKDPYKELELYLEEAKNEITQVFENTHNNGNHDVDDVMMLVEKNNELEPFLLEFNATIRSDLSEIFNRYIHNQIENDLDFNETLIAQYDSVHRNLTTYCSYDDVCEYGKLGDTLQSSIESLFISASSDSSPVNVATQTSPLSLSSTNLTWPSGSSPCLKTSISDSDLVLDQDDTASTSSLDDTNNELPTNVSVNGSNDPSNQDKWQILSAKSSSAPVLKKVPFKVNRQSRSQSDRHLAEIEADEACRWLRATGFPQYAQMYEEKVFPVDITTVAQDHPLIEPDVLESLFRRLTTLNGCAHLHQQRLNHSDTNTDESDDEHCALSENWTYQSDIKKWSRTRQPQDDAKTNLKELKAIQTNSKQVTDTKVTSSDSECSPKQTQRSRTRSFDNTDVCLSRRFVSKSNISWRKLPYSQAQVTPIESTIRSEGEGQHLSTLSCPQLQVLRKLALLKLTAYMERYCPSHRTGWNWDLPKFLRKIKTPVYKEKLIFGVPLTICVQRIGQSLPRNIEEALLCLEQNAADQVGLFRKSGVKSRIQSLKEIVETTTDILNFSEQQSYDVADLVKQYFRDLPDTLLTNKLSETFLLIFQYIPPYLRHETVLCAILLLPEEHCEALQSLLYFLIEISRHAPTNQMNESNLALCFAPSLLHYPQISTKQNAGIPHAKDLAETRAGHDCLLYLMKNYATVFKIPKEFVSQCMIGEFKETKAVHFAALGEGMGGWKGYLNECESALLRETRERGRGWMVVGGHNARVELAYKKVADGYPLRLWKVTTEVEAPPSEVLFRIVRERHKWDSELQSAKIVAQIEKRCEIFQYARRNITPLPTEEYCLVRMWRTNLPKDACIIVETSVEHQDAIPYPNSVRGIVLASRYLIEPCGSGRSRLIHLSRVDSMGKSPEWYQKNYGHICALFVANIAKSFYQNTTGPESKV